MTPKTLEEPSEPKDPPTPAGQSKAAAIWFLFVGPGAILFTGWATLIDRHYFSRWLILPLVVLYFAYAFWTYRLGKEHLALSGTWRQWVWRIVLLVCLAGPFVIIYAPALLLSLALSALIDGAWSRLPQTSPGRKFHVGAICTLLAFGLLFPLANRSYLIHGVFYTFFDSEPPRVMPNRLFDVDERRLRGPDRDGSEASHGRKILLLGDSVSWGFPYPWEDSFARHLGDRLEQRGLDVDILNAAVPGQSVVQIEARLGDLLQYEPELAILMVGYQWTRAVEHRERLDATRWLDWSPRTEWVFLPPFVPEMLHFGPRMTYRGLTGRMERWQDAEANREQFRVALEKTSLELQKAGVPVLFAGHTALKLDEEIDTLIRREAARSGSRYVDARALFSMGGEYAFADEIHPNRAGHEKIADLLVEPVSQLLSRPAAGGRGQ